MAIIGNSQPTVVDVSIKDGLLKTNGALVSMQVPAAWIAKKSTKVVNPQLPSQTRFFFKENADANCRMGLFFSGIVNEETDGRLLREDIFAKDWHCAAGTPEARMAHEVEGPFSNESRLTHAYARTGPHAVIGSSEDCLSICATEFKGMRTIIIESNDTLNNTRDIAYYIDVLNNGTVIYALYAAIPTEEYALKIDAIKQLFETSVWRTDFDPMVNLDLVE